MPVKFVDLAAQNAEVMSQIESDLSKLHQATAYVGGPQVQAFEEEFAAFLGARHVVGVGSGTDALRLALIAAGIGPEDEVITSPMTFIATAAAIRQTGARPLFVDADRYTCNLSVTKVRELLEERARQGITLPRALVPVHLYGLPAAMKEICEIAAEFGLRVIEDACQAHGAWVHDGGRWRRAGTLGVAGCFSFYPGKNLGAWGEAGAIATDDFEMAERLRSLRDHGRLSHYAHQEFGYNARLDSIQAVVLRAKLAKLIEWNKLRSQAANTYMELLGGVDVTLPAEPAGSVSSYHLFAVRSRHRDALRRTLIEDKIECGIHYPVPLHLQPACADLGYHRGDFPVSEEIADTELSLPMHPHLTMKEIKEVAAKVRAALAERPRSIGGEHLRTVGASLPPPRTT
jgi:dTDP-4-amino-4,6-dideoxygalactose transaminase